MEKNSFYALGLKFSLFYKIPFWSFSCPLLISPPPTISLVDDCVDHNKLWKILKEMGIPGHLTCLLRNPYAGQEATELDMEQQTGSK